MVSIGERLYKDCKGYQKCKIIKAEVSKNFYGTPYRSMNIKLELSRFIKISVFPPT